MRFKIFVGDILPYGVSGGVRVVYVSWGSVFVRVVCYICIYYFVVNILFKVPTI